MDERSVIRIQKGKTYSIKVAGKKKIRNNITDAFCRNEMLFRLAFRQACQLSCRDSDTHPINTSLTPHGHFLTVKKKMGKPKMAQEDDTELTDRQERTALLALELCPQFPVSEVNYQAGSLGCQSSRFNTY